MVSLKKCEFDNKLLQQSQSGWFNTRCVAQFSTESFVELMGDMFKPNTYLSDDDTVILTNHRNENIISVDKRELITHMQSALDDFYIRKNNTQTNIATVCDDREKETN